MIFENYEIDLPKGPRFETKRPSAKNPELAYLYYRICSYRVSGKLRHERVNIGKIVGDKLQPNERYFAVFKLPMPDDVLIQLNSKRDKDVERLAKAQGINIDSVKKRALLMEAVSMLTHLVGDEDKAKRYYREYKKCEAICDGNMPQQLDAKEQEKKDESAIRLGIKTLENFMRHLEVKDEKVLSLLKELYEQNHHAESIEGVDEEKAKESNSDKDISVQSVLSSEASAVKSEGPAVKSEGAATVHESAHDGAMGEASVTKIELSDFAKEKIAAVLSSPSNYFVPDEFDGDILELAKETCKAVFKQMCAKPVGEMSMASGEFADFDIQSALYGQENDNLAYLVKLFGIEFTVLDRGYVEARMPVLEQHCRPSPLGPILNGGASITFAESVAGLASMLLCHANENPVGVSVNANHVRMVRMGQTLTARATLLNQGRTSHYWQVHIFDDRDRLICVCNVSNTVIVTQKPKDKEKD